MIVEMPYGTRYLYGTDPIALVPGAVELIRSANEAGVSVGIVTNQRGVALESYAEMTEATVAQFHTRLKKRLGAKNARIDAIYVCPHDESDGCDCRKPKPGLILQALKDFSVPKESAVFVGDRASDFEAARRAGISGVLLGRADGWSTPVGDQIVFSTLAEVQEFMEPRWQHPISSLGSNHQE